MVVRNIIISVVVLFVVLCAIALYASAVVAGRYDEAEDATYEKIQEKKKEDRAG